MPSVFSVLIFLQKNISKVTGKCELFPEKETYIFYWKTPSLRKREREREREREYCIFPEFIHSEMATQFLKNPNAPFVV